jgi:hypothetical protein
MLKNEMNALCNLLGYGYSTIVFVGSTWTTTNGYLPTFGFAILTSSTINSICGYTSKGYIFYYSTFVVGIVSTCYCS